MSDKEKPNRPSNEEPPTVIAAELAYAGLLGTVCVALVAFVGLGRWLVRLPGLPNLAAFWLDVFVLAAVCSIAVLCYRALRIALAGHRGQDRPSFRTALMRARYLPAVATTLSIPSFVYMVAEVLPQFIQSHGREDWLEAAFYSFNLLLSCNTLWQLYRKSRRSAKPLGTGI